nr:helix-turn-helix transcriptional regulator [Paenibacillus forsythiae]
MKPNKELMKGSTGTMLLTLLSRQPLYGYEMLRELERRSEGVFSLKEGTLYPILHSMEGEGWVEAYWEAVNGRNRKYYRITDKGGRILNEKKAEWALFRNAVDSVIGEGGV